MKIYGIKNCTNVKRALSFFDSRKIAYDFIDLKLTNPLRSDLERWLKSHPIDRLFNAKSSTYRSLNLKELSLDDEGKIEWILKEPRLLKRPVIECEDGTILVGFDIKNCEKIFND
ncbi:MAG: arsenate reductase family protein [Wolinella sp.]